MPKGSRRVYHFLFRRWSKMSRITVKFMSFFDLVSALCHFLPGR